MSTATAVHELVGTTVACHKGIAGLVCGSLDIKIIMIIKINYDN